MIEAKKLDWFDIKTHGRVYVCQLPEGTTASDVKIMMKNGEKISIDGTSYGIKGVESFRPDDDKVGILIKSDEL